MDEIKSVSQSSTPHLPLVNSNSCDNRKQEIIAYKCLKALSHFYPCRNDPAAFLSIHAMHFVIGPVLRTSAANSKGIKRAL